MRSILRETLFLCVFMLVCLGSAWAGGPESPSGASVPLLTQPSPLSSPWQIRSNQFRLPDHPRTYSGAPQGRETVCYTMRTYLMAQDDPHSDITRLVGYTTCQPDSQVELRFSDESAAK
jgi:hypothetical protein